MTLYRTNKKIWNIAWPMMLSSMSVPLLGMVDTALLGHLDSEQFLGAVAIGANFIGLMYWSFGFLRMGTTSLVAQNLGETTHNTAQTAEQGAEKDGDGIVFRSLLLGGLLGLAICLLIPLLTETVVRWMQASANVSPLAQEYIDIRRYSAPAVFMTFAVSGWLVGLQQARAALALVLITNLSNIVLDVIFIVYLGLGSAGAAWATLIAEYGGLLAGIGFLSARSGVLQTAGWRRWLSTEKFLSLINFNYHLFIRTVLLLFVFNFFTAQGAGFGDDTLAANAILLQLVLFSAFVMDGFSFAAEALCGEAFGGRQWTQLKRVIKLCARWMGATAVVFSGVYWLAGISIIGLFSDMEALLSTAYQYRYWIVVLPLAGFVAYLMDGICIGAGKTPAMHYSMLFSALMVFLPAWWLCRDLGNHGLWLAFTLFNLARGVTLGAYWYRLKLQ